jgi:hypothetical protein
MSPIDAGGSHQKRGFTLDGYVTIAYMDSYVTAGMDHMAMTNAEKQAAFRQRRDDRIREMEDQLRNQGAVHSEAPKAALDLDELEALRKENDDLKAAMAASPDLLFRTIHRLMSEIRALKRQARRAPSASKAQIKLTSNKRLRNGEPADESIAPVKVEEPRRENAALNWTDYGEGFTAVTPAGTYGVIDLARRGSGGFGAFLRPAQGRARLPKGGQALGNFATLDEAKAACQEHTQRLRNRG